MCGRKSYSNYNLASTNAEGITRDYGYEAMFPNKAWLTIENKPSMGSWQFIFLLNYTDCIQE